MKDKKISSAGLVYVYISGYEEDGRLYVGVTDSYRLIEDGFYNAVMEQALIADEYEDMIHIFAVVGEEEKASKVISLIEEMVVQNYQRIIAGEDIETEVPRLDTMGNVFCECVQEFYCEQPNHYPKRLIIEKEDFIFAGICCGALSDDRVDSIADEIAELWIKREEPGLYGKQLMTKSFFLRDFTGRKVVACFLKGYTGEWCTVFEGGHQLVLGDGTQYMKETVHPDELGGFSVSNLQTILLNPIYAYGKWLIPNDLCEEWHKVFIYLCAASDYEWNHENIVSVYEQFLEFLQDNICEIVMAEPMIEKKLYFATILIQIKNFRDFLRGEDEVVISKDLHQTLNSRYVYLPYIWPLVPHDNITEDFSATHLSELVTSAINAKSAHEKGALWEDVAAYALRSIPEWKITGRRIKAGAQEIDISIASVSLNDTLWKMGAYILVECKNRNVPVGLPHIRNIAHICNMKGNKTAILFTANGITSDAMAEIIRLTNQGIFVICITAEELLTFEGDKDFLDLLIEKWEDLQSEVEQGVII